MRQGKKKFIRHDWQIYIMVSLMKGLEIFMPVYVCIGSNKNAVNE